MRGPAAPTSPGPWDSRSRSPLTAAAPPVPVAAPAVVAAEAIQQTPARPARPVRRGPADPVTSLLHRHRALCERAVDPLEIAAGLEAQGLTDRTAARFRHRDVFSLAEELYARVPHDETLPVRPDPPRTPWTGPAGWTLAACAPGAVAVLALAGLALTTGPVRAVAGVLGALATGAALFLAVREGPLRAPVRPLPTLPLWTLWLLAYAAAGDGFLDQVLRGGPDHAPAVVTPWGPDAPGGAWVLDTGPLLALALSVAPAAWCAHLFAARARSGLVTSRGLAAFAARTRPLLLGAVAGHLAVLTGLLLLTGFHPGALALGVLLLLARLLTAYGLAEAAGAVLGTTCAAEAVAVASVLAARLPGCTALGVPVRAVTDLWGPAALPVLLCGTAALALLVHATTALSRASAHA
jgi:hypothetical protein